MDLLNLNNAPWQGDTACGRFKIVYDSPDGRCSLAYFEISRPTIPHKHQKMTEMYFVKSGLGFIRIEDEAAFVKSGNRIIIPAGQVHQIKPIHGILEIEVLTDPRFNIEDIIEFPEYFS